MDGGSPRPWGEIKNVTDRRLLKSYLAKIGELEEDLAEERRRRAAANTEAETSRAEALEARHRLAHELKTRIDSDREKKDDDLDVDATANGNQDNDQHAEDPRERFAEVTEHRFLLEQEVMSLRRQLEIAQSAVVAAETRAHAEAGEWKYRLEAALAASRDAERAADRYRLERDDWEREALARVVDGRDTVVADAAPLPSPSRSAASPGNQEALRRTEDLAQCKRNLEEARQACRGP